MDPDSCYQIIMLVVLLMLSALFTAAETAMVSLNKYRLRHLVSDLNPKAIMISRFLNEPDKLHETVLIGDGVANCAAIVLGTTIALNLWGQKWGLIYAIIFLSIIVVIFGEILPRIAASKNPERMSLILIRILFIIMIILYPIVKFFSIFSMLFTKILRIPKTPGENGVTEEAIIELVTAGQEDGVIHQEERTMIHGVFDFTDKVVRDVIVPRPDIIAVEQNISYRELMEIIKEEQFSRIPVYENNIDNILGVLHIKDLIMAEHREQDSFSPGDYLRPTLFIPETKKVNDLFKTMKKEKIHLCIVLDEYGSTAGLVTLEDLIEEIMGDIQDEHDMEEPELLKIDADTVEINASMRIDEINEKLDISLQCEEAETLGGLVFAELGRIPLEGDVVKINDIELVVQEMDGHRIEKLRLNKSKEDDNLE